MAFLLIRFNNAGVTIIKQGGVIKMTVIISIIGLCAVALLSYYVYILMKGDSQIMSSVFQYIFYLAIVVILAIPLGTYIKKSDEWREDLFVQKF